MRPLGQVIVRTPEGFLNARHFNVGEGFKGKVVLDARPSCADNEEKTRGPAFTCVSLWWWWWVV